MSKRSYFFDAPTKGGLFPKQEAFVTSPSKHPIMMGSVGGAKTVAGCWRALVFSTQQPAGILRPGERSRGLILRKYMPQLKISTMQTFYEEVCPPDWIATRNDSEQFCVFQNGARIDWLSFEDTHAVQKLKNINADWFFVDQIEDLPEELWAHLCSRIRRTQGANAHSGWGVGNMNGHDWIWRTWKYPLESGKADSRWHSLYDLIEVYPGDNPMLPPNYYETLRSQNSLHWCKRYIDASWDSFEGKVFEEFTPANVLPHWFEIPREWHRFRAIDFGLTNPTCCLWFAVDPFGRIFIYREYYRPGGLVSDHVQAIRSAEELDWVPTYADPSMFSKTRENAARHELWSVADEFEEAGLTLSRANNSVLPSINRICQSLRSTHTADHPTPDEQSSYWKKSPSPLLYILDNCTHLLDEIARYSWQKVRPDSPTNAPEKPRKKEDHAVDSMRYGVMSMPGPTELPPTPVEFYIRGQSSPKVNEEVMNALLLQQYGIDRSLDRSAPTSIY